MAEITKRFEVVKSSGEVVPFSLPKLTASLRKSGADTAMVEEVLRQLEPNLYEGIPTKKIYRLAYAILKRLSKSTAARYSLKQGIMQLGPSGFPFEKFIAEILNSQGYSTRIGEFINGHCVRHEIDVVAAKDGRTYMIECKFHNLAGTKSDVKVPMYIHSRFKDVETVRLSDNEMKTRFHQGWVVTNTRFTDDAIRYGTCMSMHLIGWDFPAKGSLKDLTDVFELYPLTCLTTLTNAEKQYLLEQNLVLCKELLSNEALLLKVGIKHHRLDGILQEIRNLCGHTQV